MEIVYKEIGDLAPFEGNPRTRTDETLFRLVKSIKEFGFAEPVILWRNAKECGYPENCIIGGHRRVDALLWLIENEGIEPAPIPCIEIDCPSVEKAKALNIALNKIGEDFDTPMLVEWLTELDAGDFDLEATGFSEAELEKLLAPAIEASMVYQVDAFELSDDEKAMIQGVDRIPFAFSGGRDSALAVFALVPYLKEIEKEYELLFVRTGVEIPDIEPYVVEFAEFFELPLTILKPRKNFIQYYHGRKTFPFPAIRECIHDIINEPQDRHNKEKGDSHILVRGGRAKQKTKLSRSARYQEIEKGKDTVRLFNPLFDLSDEGYDALAAEFAAIFHFWPGYERGFVRTACWCCPFQKVDQYAALKTHYPVLWSVLREWTLTWDVYDSGMDRLIKAAAEL